MLFVDGKVDVFSISSWPKAIAHIDADAFFVECERATNPTLKEKCVATGKERGIVTSLSYEAKAKGVKRGMTIYEAKRVCPDIIIVQSDYEKYSLFSVRMFDILRRFSPVVEEYSIDEAFVDLTGLRSLYHSSYEGIVRRIQETIKKELDISVSVGVAPTKVLAKIGSRLNKPYGVTVIKAKEIHLYLKKVKVEDVWGIGKNTAAFLNKFDIETALEFATQGEHFVRKYLSIPYMTIYRELRGESVLNVVNGRRLPHKSISRSKSFHKPTTDKEILLGELVNNLEKACQKARRYKLAARKLVVFLKTKDFTIHSHKVNLRNASNMPHILIGPLKSAFMGIYRKNVFYRQTGVVLGDLTTKRMYDLFEDMNKMRKMITLYEAIDKINEMYGTKTVRLARSMLSFEKGFTRQIPNIPILKGLEI